MKCHYDVLNVSRDSSLEEIKKAYKKLAIKWHPDKNLDNVDAATEQFQLIQQAFEVLSDPHERAWYDDHRDAILKGKVGGECGDNSIDVYQYFTATCYKGFGDDEKGFYAVYREVFNRISAEDSEYFSDGDSDIEIPSFGTSLSSIDEVKLFYAHWQSYCTKKSYSWLDPYDVRTAENRRVSRIIEKENKKVRDKARKARNEEVRELVSFVRKRDKRMQLHAQQLQKLNEEKATKTEERRREKIRERKKELESHKESEWSKFSNLENELKVIEAKLVSEFGETVSDASSDANIDDQLYCIACNKLFKTTKAFENHESSKKHKENVLILKQNMLDGSGSEYGTSGESAIEDGEVGEYEGTVLSNLDDDPLFCEACAEQFENLEAIDKHKKTKKHLNNLKLYKEAMRGLIEEEEGESEYDPSNKLFDDINPNSKPSPLVKTLFKGDTSDNNYNQEEATKRIMDQIGKFTRDNDSIKENVEKLCNELDEILDSPISEDSDNLNDLLSETLASGHSKPLKSEIKNIPSAFPATFFDSDDDHDFSTESRKKPKKKRKQKTGPKLQSIKKNSNKVISVVTIDSEPVNLSENETSSVSQDSVLGSCPTVSSKEKLVSSKKITDKKKKKHSENNTSDVNSTCAVCKETFSSKNKLFLHLSKTGHSVYLGDKEKLLSKVEIESSNSIKRSKSQKSAKCK